MTIKFNKEYSSFIIKTKKGYKLSKLVRGSHSSVAFNAIKGCLLNLFAEVHFIHTHTRCNCHIPDKFSGNPQRPITQAGDVSVVKVLKYHSIYLVAPDGRIYQLRKNNAINTKEELRRLKPVAYTKVNG